MAFERTSLIQSRYDLIRRPDSAPLGFSFRPGKEQEDGNFSKKYSAFLKEQERKVGPDGFVDSGRFSHTYEKQKNSRAKSSNSNTPRVDLLKVKFHNTVQTEQQNHEKCLKAIEDLMWQHKQEERELKRTEGDIVKNQQSVRHTLRDYENAINKKKLSESKKLSQSLEKYTVLQQDHMHQKERKTLNRIQNAQNGVRSLKDNGRKVDLKKTDLARKYRSKISEIDLKRTELMRLNEDYETKLRLKEEEQFKLKQEAANLALSLNMETLKGKKKIIATEKQQKEDKSRNIQEDLKSNTEFTSHLAKSDGDIKTTEAYNRKLSADLSRTKNHLGIKKRDEQRHLTDTKIRLNGNISTQKQLNEEAFNIEMDKKVKSMNQKLQDHNDRRVHQLHNNLKNKKETREGQQAILEAKFKKRQLEQHRREHEDSLKFFQKMVTKDEDAEQELYNKVRTSEYNRQKQEQTLRRLELNLDEMKRKNAVKLKQEITERNAQELQLEQEIIREKAELEKLHVRREESYLKLHHHRHIFKEDKHLLQKHSEEHSRLIRIGNRSQALLAN